ncbi:hypothetical protein TRIUR3_29829 [Triticum urartu]|uniref:Pentacotripeptide-repeat region of PRORP domain-containing protein n=1 Tax=Triticum urartu TaxID=4572 RepID=M7ZQK0_TRIUA|nr:hypothetical protein TRIUR3_29829 [Triticum urartu]
MSAPTVSYRASLDDAEVNIGSPPLASFDFHVEEPAGEEEEEDEDVTEIGEEVFEAGGGARRPIRTTNYTEVEDVLLVKAWLQVGLDAVIGTDQTGKRYWQRIEDRDQESAPKKPDMLKMDDSDEEGRNHDKPDGTKKGKERMKMEAEASSLREKIDQMIKSKETLARKALETKLIITERKKEVKLAQLEARREDAKRKADMKERMIKLKEAKAWKELMAEEKEHMMMSRKDMDEEQLAWWKKYKENIADRKRLLRGAGGGALSTEFPSALGPDTVDAYLFHLARAGRATDALKVFDELPGELRTRGALTSLVSSLSSEGFPQLAERAVKKIAHEIFPDDNICTLLVSGYADAGKLDHALRLIGETRNGGFQPGLDAYNAVLDCVCRLCRKKDPLRMPVEAEKFLVDMEANGIPRDAGTFRVLIKNLCKIRRTEDAMNLFRQMGEWGCSPDADTYLVLIKSLYQAARTSEGDELMIWMRSAGFGDKLDRKAYYGFMKVLCGIERVEHAVKVFRLMKGYGHAPGTKSYSLLIEKLASHNLGDRSNALFREAVARGVTVTPGVYKIDKRYVKEKKEKKVKKKLTLPEKKILKSKRLYKLKMSFVKKPKRRMRA